MPAEIPVLRIYMFPWASKTFCFDFSTEGALQGPTPATLSAPVVAYVPVVASPPAPLIGAPEIIAADFYNSKGDQPKKVGIGNGVAVRFTGGGTTVAGEYPVKCEVMAGGDKLTVAAVLVVSDNPT